MIKGANSASVSNSSCPIPTQEQVYNLFEQQMEKIVDIRESLEATHWRSYTENALYDLVFQLQDITKEICSLPPSTLETYKLSKKTLLQRLRSALIELLLSIDQITEKGRTSVFYKHISSCLIYLEEIIEMTKTYPSFAQEDNSELEVELESFLRHIRKHYSVFLTTQSALENAYASSLSSKQVSIGKFDRIYDTLNAMHAIIQETSAFLNKPSSFLEGSSQVAYQFCINFSYLDEQIPTLQEQINTFCSIYDASSRQSKKISNEICYKLDAIIHCCREVPAALTALFDQSQCRKKAHHQLQLVYSSESEIQ